MIRLTPEREKEIREYYLEGNWSTEDVPLEASIVRQLLAELDLLRADRKSLLDGYRKNEVTLGILRKERDSFREKLQAEYQNNKIDKLNIESADDRYEILYQITHEEIDELKEKIAMALEALIHSTQKHEYCALIEEAIEKIRGEK